MGKALHAQTCRLETKNKQKNVQNNFFFLLPIMKEKIPILRFLRSIGSVRAVKCGLNELFGSLQSKRSGPRDGNTYAGTSR